MSAKSSDISSKTEDWYKEYYKKRGGHRNSLLSNRGVLFQHLAFEDSVISALREAKNIDIQTSKILDVGCGSGGSLARFLQLGCSPRHLYGVDIIQNRIDEGRDKYPNMNLYCDDAVSMSFEPGSFDLVMESTMFVQVTDDAISQQISEEMLRVTKDGGYLLIVDWRYGKPGNSDYLAVNRKRIENLFSVGSITDVVCQKDGALVPPIGRTLSRYLPSAYFLVRALLPFLTGSKATLLQKRPLIAGS